MNIFDPDGFFVGMLGKLSDLVFLNFTFVIFSLPLFTIGASVAALYECTFSLLEDTEDQFVPRQFFRAFKRHFKRGTGAWFLSLLPILFLFAYSRVIGYFSGSLARTYKITFFILVFLFAIGFEYVFPMIAITDRKVMSIVKLVWPTAISALPWSLLNLVAVVGLTALTYFIPANTAIYLWGFLFIALIVFFSSMILKQVFVKFFNEEYEARVILKHN